jgi:flagellar hook assembly protein FlgD
MGGVNDKLQVAYRLASATSVTAKIYDTRGQLVTILMDGDVGSVGGNLLTWDGRKSDGGYANDGLYILTIESDGESVKKTFVILNR